MAKLIEIPSTIEKMPVFAQRLQVAAYCRVITEQEEHLESQEKYYSQIISRNPLWTTGMGLSIIKTDIGCNAYKPSSKGGWASVRQIRYR